MRVRLVTSFDAAIIRLVGRVHVAVLLAVAGVGESPVAALKFALERLLTCERNGKNVSVKIGHRDPSPLPSQKSEGEFRVSKDVSQRFG